MAAAVSLLHRRLAHRACADLEDHSGRGASRAQQRHGISIAPVLSDVQRVRHSRLHHRLRRCYPIDRDRCPQAPRSPCSEVAPMTAIQIQIVRKTYRPKGEPGAPPILQDLSIRLGSGEFACLVGPSGCGKTTLLNIAAGLDRDFEGWVRIETDTGKPHIGYVFQNPRLIPWRTVRENIELALPKEADPAYIDHLFEVVGLADAQNVFPERLSLGMSRR